MNNINYDTQNVTYKSSSAKFVLSANKYGEERTTETNRQTERERERCQYR